MLQAKTWSEESYEIPQAREGSQVWYLWCCIHYVDTFDKSQKATFQWVQSEVWYVQQRIPYKFRVTTAHKQEPWKKRICVQCMWPPIWKYVCFQKTQNETWPRFCTTEEIPVWDMWQNICTWKISEPACKETHWWKQFCVWCLWEVCVRTLFPSEPP
jgi:hypothetical protein